MYNEYTWTLLNWIACFGGINRNKQEFILLGVLSSLCTHSRGWEMGPNEQSYRGPKNWTSDLLIACVTKPQPHSSARFKWHKNASIWDSTKLNFSRFSLLKGMVLSSFIAVTKINRRNAKVTNNWENTTFNPQTYPLHIPKHQVCKWILKPGLQR